MPTVNFPPPDGPPPPPTSGPPPLPDGWSAHWSQQYGSWFYVDPDTNISQWEHPFPQSTQNASQCAQDEELAARLQSEEDARPPPQPSRPVRSNTRRTAPTSTEASDAALAASLQAKEDARARRRQRSQRDQGQSSNRPRPQPPQHPPPQNTACNLKHSPYAGDYAPYAGDQPPCPEQQPPQPPNHQLQQSYPPMPPQQYGPVPYGPAPYEPMPHEPGPYATGPYGPAPHGPAQYGPAPYGQASYGSSPYGPPGPNPPFYPQTNGGEGSGLLDKLANKAKTKLNAAGIPVHPNGQQQQSGPYGGPARTSSRRNKWGLPTSADVSGLKEMLKNRNKVGQGQRPSHRQPTRL